MAILEKLRKLLAPCDHSTQRIHRVNGYEAVLLCHKCGETLTHFEIREAAVEYHRDLEDE